jgi:hypothetical protein
MFNKSAALLLVVLLVTALPLSAQAVHARLTIPVEEAQVTTNPCTGEAVLVTFSGFISIHLVFNDNVATGQTQIMLHGEGTAISSGSSYILNSALSQAENFDAALDGTIVATLIQRLEFISEGRGSNLLVEARNHITINADGRVTVSTTEMTSACRA